MTEDLLAALTADGWTVAEVDGQIRLQRVYTYTRRRSRSRQRFLEARGKVGRGEFDYPCQHTDTITAETLEEAAVQARATTRMTLVEERD
jgi:hypothetical protein